MAGLIARVKAKIRETDDAEAIRALPPEQRPILAYVEDDYSWNQLGGYLEAVMSQSQLPVVYVTSDPDDPRFTTHAPLMSVYYIKETLPRFLPDVDSPVFVTTMPDLDTFHIKRPVASTCVYVFHSLNSTHMAYRKGAFDAYDVFFCTGPYQREELRTRFERIGKESYDLREVGYYKLDRIHESYLGYSKRHPAETTILIASTWGPDNVLAVDGASLIEPLADAGYRVVVRPHPAFFESIYPEGKKIAASLQRRFGDRDNVVFEKAITTENSFMEADLMISDWSGAASEYAFGTERPVLFMDLPPKANNADWEEIDIVPFEARIRKELGSITPPGEPRSTLAAVEKLLDDRNGYRGRIRELREQSVYNFGNAAAVGARVLAELAG